MKKEQKSLIKKALEFLSLSMNDTIELAKYTATDGTEIEVADDGTTSAADGSYTLEDGTVLTVASGVATITEPAKDETKEVAAADAAVADDSVSADVTSATDSLQQAIDLHGKHMDGTAPTDAVSQQEMMDLMQKALSFLNGTDEVAAKADDKMKMAAETENKVAELEAKLAEMEAKHASEKQTLSKQVAELEKEPAAKTVNLSTDKEDKKLTPAELRLQRYFEENNIK